MTNLENKLTNIAYYFEGIQPINEGFQNSKIIYSSNMIEIIINIDKNKINNLSNKADKYLKSKKYNL